MIFVILLSDAKFSQILSTLRVTCKLKLIYASKQRYIFLVFTRSETTRVSQRWETGLTNRMKPADKLVWYTASKWKGPPIKRASFARINLLSFLAVTFIELQLISCTINSCERPRNFSVNLYIIRVTNTFNFWCWIYFKIFRFMNIIVGLLFNTFFSQMC